MVFFPKRWILISFFLCALQDLKSSSDQNKRKSAVLSLTLLQDMKKPPRLSFLIAILFLLLNVPWNCHA